jgi:hypothetical protein
MKKIMQISDFFRLKNNNLIIVGNYSLDAKKNKEDIISQIGSKIEVISPSGKETIINAMSKDVSISFVGIVNLAIELPKETNENDIAIGSEVFVIE